MGCEQSKDGQAWAHGNHGEIPNGKIEVGQEALERYIALENEIAKLEANSPRMVLEHKREQLKQITFNITDQEVVVESLNEAAVREKRDVDALEDDPDTKQLFLDQGTWEAQQEKEMQEYLDALNKQPNNNEDGTKGQVLEMQQANNEPGVVEESAREAMAALNSQEIAETELSNMRDQKSNLEAEIVSLELDVEQLQSLYEEQETILDRIFGGAYGSEDENHLESSLDQHEQMRNRIVEANFKWRQAQLMVDYAYKQLEHAVTKWTDVQTIDPSNLEQRYAVASETRNNLVAASQNIQGAQRYLSNVQFPYCAPPEVETLNKATAYIFTDMQTPDRHEHAMECYTITSKRCGALLQWITQVVSQTISRDLDDINAKVKEASMKLRTERVRLIKEKVKEVMGKDVDIAVADVNTDVKVDLNLNDLAMTEGIDPNSLTLTAEELKALGLLLEEDLAPPPSQTEVFGEQMERLNQTYREDADRVQRQIEESRERMHQKLEQQLAVRRQRRARKNIEAKEREALIAS